MKFFLSPVQRAFLKDLQKLADEKLMDIDYETMTLVPIQGFMRSWERGDNDPADPEQADWDDVNDERTNT